jgi:hypothetical protein
MTDYRSTINVPPWNGQARQMPVSLAESIGNDDAAMRAYEERIGHVTKPQAAEAAPATAGSNEPLPSATIH